MASPRIAAPAEEDGHDIIPEAWEGFRTRLEGAGKKEEGGKGVLFHDSKFTSMPGLHAGSPCRFVASPFDRLRVR